MSRGDRQILLLPEDPGVDRGASPRQLCPLISSPDFLFPVSFPSLHPWVPRDPLPGTLAPFSKTSRSSLDQVCGCPCVVGLEGLGEGNGEAGATLLGTSLSSAGARDWRAVSGSLPTADQVCRPGSDYMGRQPRGRRRLFCSLLVFSPQPFAAGVLGSLILPFPLVPPFSFLGPTGTGVPQKDKR